MAIAFCKMHGLGNDFVVINSAKLSLEATPAWIQTLADRRRGVGCDQVLFVQPYDQQPNRFKYQIFNASGEEVGQCGNGARCIARYLYDQQMVQGNKMELLTGTAAMTAEVLTNQQVCVNMGLPRFEPEAIPMNVEHQAEIYRLMLDPESKIDLTFSALSLGNPHAVFFVDDVTHLAINDVAKMLMQKNLFPEGVNIGFAEITNRSKIMCRVVERGVGETQACGSGACAAAVAGRLLGFVDDKIQVKLLGGELTIEWKGEGHPVFMTGPAEYVFAGEYWG